MDIEKLKCEAQNKALHIADVSGNALFNADCMDILPLIPEKSVQLILADLPYGTTGCKWDSVIPFNKHIILTDACLFPKKSKQKIMYEDEFLLHCFKQGMTYENAKKCFDKNAVDGMWEQLKRIIKPNGAIVLFGSQPFTSALVMSNPKMFKYEWVWEKAVGSNFATLKYQPMKEHENILVFGYGKTTYYPIKEKRKGSGNERIRHKYNALESKTGETTGSLRNIDRTGNYNNLRNPSSVQYFNNREKNRGLHSTQKPVALMEYLIKTYTNEGETVLDFTMGSGTIGVACKNLNRSFIGIELNEDYYLTAKKRIENHSPQGWLFSNSFQTELSIEAGT